MQIKVRLPLRKPKSTACHKDIYVIVVGKIIGAN